MKRFALIITLATAAPATADTLHAARTLPVGHVISPDDLTTSPDTLRGYLSNPDQAIGQEAAITIYADRPLSASMLVPPALVDRNQIVLLVFEVGGLAITTEGRALARGAAGDVIRVMNLSSRQTLFAEVRPDGTVAVK